MNNQYQYPIPNHQFPFFKANFLVVMLESLLVKPIRNSQFAITFCDGDLDPDTKRAAYLAGDLNPQSSLKMLISSQCFRDSAILHDNKRYAISKSPFFSSNSSPTGERDRFYIAKPLRGILRTKEEKFLFFPNS
ncbi:hypothetical protein NIES4072_41560 [Nostoc commune NIES-4072]|uniref:Uncharacterized protein n=1 Tax=Nostoc commune NIES-4072 TaxID=2005467 RepID=A0A2R5FNX8_NOSCO|nr:hypothetical protein NIES4070_49290 [Nostoc commune HK-02]GBG20477.1 hypothetical protein NIES4072_41560 [Nostoc commune NIES-4072]